MPVAKKDQERVTYAWMYGMQALKDGKERVVPAYWEENAEAWLRGFDACRWRGWERPRLSAMRWKRKLTPQRSSRRLEPKCRAEILR